MNYLATKMHFREGSLYVHDPVGSCDIMIASNLYDKIVIFINDVLSLWMGDERSCVRVGNSLIISVSVGHILAGNCIFTDKELKDRIYDMIEQKVIDDDLCQYINNIIYTLGKRYDKAMAHVYRYVDYTNQETAVYRHNMIKFASLTYDAELLESIKSGVISEEEGLYSVFVQFSNIMNNATSTKSARK